jgi:hypothetical protein
VATVNAQKTKLFILIGLLAVMSTRCGDVARSSRAPGQLVITNLTAAASTGGVPSSFPQSAGPLLSDVITNGSVFNDFGEVTMRLVLRDPGIPGAPSAPSDLNLITVTRYRVVYRRSNTESRPGIDVPQGFDGAMTVTVGETAVAGVFELVRHIAKIEPPLANLAADRAVITTIADITFYGRDQAGNDVSVTGSIQVNFANFADPTP